MSIKLQIKSMAEREAVYLAWTSVDLDRGILRVRSNPEYGFKVKDKEQRDLPIPDDLLKHLRKYRAAHPKRRLVTGTAPSPKLLMYAQPGREVYGQLSPLATRLPHV